MSETSSLGPVWDMYQQKEKPDENDVINTLRGLRASPSDLDRVKLAQWASLAEHQDVLFEYALSDAGQQTAHLAFTAIMANTSFWSNPDNYEPRFAWRRLLEKWPNFWKTPTGSRPLKNCLIVRSPIITQAQAVCRPKKFRLFYQTKKSKRNTTRTKNKRLIRTKKGSKISTDFLQNPSTILLICRMFLRKTAKTMQKTDLKTKRIWIISSPPAPITCVRLLRTRQTSNRPKL